MARNSYNLLELDVDKLFEDHKIEEIVEIEKLLDAEIERKRVELRSMVGDRYKDVLAASDAIKNMKTISQDIVDNIEKITDICEELITNTSQNDSKPSISVYRTSDEERVLIVQVRLAIFMNEQIWTALDKRDNLTAAQFYLLAQHIHIGLSLSKKEYLDRLPLLRQIKSNLQTLRDQIFQRIEQNLEFVEITAEETSSNLNALLLLKNQSTSELLNIFIDHRKIALNTVMNTSHASVRVQISAMVRCLMTTIHLLHDCFTRDNERGLIWQQLDSIVEDSSIPTISKVELPTTPLLGYVPDTVRQFRPKYPKAKDETIRDTEVLDQWLGATKSSIQKGLQSPLRLVTNVKGLHMVREEALKIEVPVDWEKICAESKLPNGFDVWYYFFQDLITQRAKELISGKVRSIIKDLQKDIGQVLDQSEKSEVDLRWYTWVEDPDDMSRVENRHVGLSMKTLGYTKNIVELCQKLDEKFWELLSDVSLYLYGREFDDGVNLIIVNPKSKKKFIDREELEGHLRCESAKNSTEITLFLEDFVKSETTPQGLVVKSLMCARFLQAITNLCPNFNKCCTFNGSTDDWGKICSHFSRASLQFWEKWVDRCVQNTDREAKKLFAGIGVCSMISIVSRWDTIEIQEQTEERVFKSQIKVPLKPSLVLLTILNRVNDDLGYVLPHTVPKQIHLQFVERCVDKVLAHYKALADGGLNQNQALQFLFDVKFLTTFCIQRENARLVGASQDICDRLRGRIDPFDLDVFYSYLQNNVKRAVMQSQVILGCLLPSSSQLANLGVSEKSKEQEKEPSVLALSVPSVSFPLFSTFAHQIPSQKSALSNIQQASKVSSPKPSKLTPKKSQDPTAALRSSAAALFGGLTTDWFS